MTVPFTISQPGEKTLATLVGGFTVALAGLAVWDCFAVAAGLGLTLWQSKTLMAVALLRLALMLAGLGLVGLAYFLPRGFSILSASLSSVFQGLEGYSSLLRPLSVLVIPGLLALYLFIFLKTSLGGFFAEYSASKYLLFWIFGLIGSVWIKTGWRLPWFRSWLLALLFLSAGYRLALFLPELTSDPFSLGWSEGSRIYLPSLFNSVGILGKAMPLPILHPTLHLLLFPPYLFDAPILAHRLWRVFLLISLSGFTSHALLHRFGNFPRWTRLILTVWIGLALLTLPVYLHLLVPVLLLLVFVSGKNSGRTLAALALASVWAGLSRINWYPVPALLTIALLILERKDSAVKARDVLSYGWMFLGGTALAALSMQTYIRLSGIPQGGDFFTSLSSSLLWDRLLPSQTYPLGVLPGILIFASPFVASLIRSFQSNPQPAAGHSMTGILILALELIALFLGGLLVSSKIGGGSDIHNMDAFVLLLILITLGLFFAQKPARLPWGIALAMVLVPASYNTASLPSFTPSSPQTWQTNLQAIQNVVDANNAAGKATLFISQRQLVSLGMIQNVNLDPLYDREDLMEMAMSGNQAYLDRFNQKLESHQFGAIIVDPLTFTYKGTADAMGAEHNAWTRSVIRPILCNYQASQILPEARVAIYLPLASGQNCPNLPPKVK